MDDQRDYSWGDDDREFVIFEDNQPAPPPEAPERRFGAGRFLRRYAITLIALLLLASAGGLLWLETQKRFPMLEPGAYAGRMTGLEFGEGQADNLYLEFRGEGSDILAVVLKTHWAPQMIPAVAARTLGSAMVPLTLIGPDSRYRLVGSKVGQGTYQGALVDLVNGGRGTWVLNQVPTDSISAAAKPGLQGRLLQKAELDTLLEEGTRLKAEAERLSGETSEMKEALNDPGRLQELFAGRMAAAKAKAKEETDRFREKGEEMRDLTSQLEVAQRVTVAGRLVSLARESLEREERWLRSLAKTGTPKAPREIEEGFAHAEQIMNLRREIAREREDMARRNQPPTPASLQPGPDLPNFNDLWKR